MCAIQRVNGQDESAFEWSMVVGATRTALSVPRTAVQLGFSRSTVSCVYQEWTSKGHPANFAQLWGRIGVTMGQHPCGTLSTPCRVHAQTN